VNDGEQAIARIPIEQPDIVLADIGMPKKGGYDVAAFVKGRSESRAHPVLLLAGAFEPVDQARAEQVRCDGVLIKPFEPRQVIERVRELLEGVKGSPGAGHGRRSAPGERLAPRPEPHPAAPSAPAAGGRAGSRNRSRTR
jgi:CheY-like chemotaxis protein